jgi:hypothetical protein
MVYLDSPQYRLEAITYAKAEIRKRGISPNQLKVVSGADSPSRRRLATFLRNVRRYRSAIAFFVGFISITSYFAWANYASYMRTYERNCDDCFYSFGFPFYLYQGGGFAGPENVLWAGFIGDVTIAGFFSICGGWMLRVLVSRYSARQDAV